MTPDAGRQQQLRRDAAARAADRRLARIEALAAADALCSKAAAVAANEALRAARRRRRTA